MSSQIELKRLAARVGRQLLASRRRLVTAESCTGGWVAKAITDIAGSSQWFEGGYVTYSNETKKRTLGVSAETLARHGAVSEQVAREMARGAIAASGADVAVAITGIAGPDGGSPDKPVGTVWFCWAMRHGKSLRLTTRKSRYRGDRAAVRSQSVATALREILTASARALHRRKN
jgi:nicotinamide-nucleotide amidase